MQQQHSEGDPRDARVRAANYLREHRVVETLQAVVAELLLSKPPDARAALAAALERAKTAGLKPLLTARDLRAMFAMIDITHAGRVTVAQARAALATALGPAVTAGWDTNGAAASASNPLLCANGGSSGSSSCRSGGGATIADDSGSGGNNSGARLLDADEFVRYAGELALRATPHCNLKSLPTGDEDGGGDE